MGHASQFNLGKRPLVPTADDWLNETPIFKAWAKPWPRPIAYQHKHNAKCAERFVAERGPRKIISSFGILYSLHQDGLWRELTESQLETEITNTDGETFLDVHNVKKMVQSMHQRHAVRISPFEWLDKHDDDPAPEDLMLFCNGRYDVKRGTLTPHDGRYFATEAPAYPFRPSATCKLWDRVVVEWLDSQDQHTLHEFIGYLLTSDMSLQKMLVMLGPPRSGKSTVMTILEVLCGSVHVVSRTIDDLCGPFGLDGVQGKRLMTIPDAHDADTKSHHVGLNRLKSIVGRDTISINKKYENIENVLLSARIVMHANRHPRFLDDSGALAAREVILSFKNGFIGREDEALSTKLKGQLSGIANRAIAGLHRLRSNQNKFTKGASAKKAADLVRQDQSPAFEYATACLEVTKDPADFISDAMLAESYEGWCYLHKITGTQKRSTTQLKKDLETAFAPHVTRTQRRIRPGTEGASMQQHGLSGIISAYDPHRSKTLGLG
jgi:phage/plasmid-associated DNA primase